MCVFITGGGGGGEIGETPNIKTTTKHLKRTHYMFFVYYVKVFISFVRVYVVDEYQYHCLWFCVTSMCESSNRIPHSMQSFYENKKL